jgi:hypothetical protein
MSRSKQKGSSFESLVANYLSDHLNDDRIERRVIGGTNDRGDIAGVRFQGERVVIECKNHKRQDLAEWIDEVEVERGNDDAAYGVVVFKRPGKGAKKAGENYVAMTLETFTKMLGDGNVTE